MKEKEKNRQLKIPQSTEHHHSSHSIGIVILHIISIQQEKIQVSSFINSFCESIMDDDSSEEWKASLNSTLNRLSNQYLTLLRAASSEMALDDSQIDQRGECVCLQCSIFMPVPVMLGWPIDTLIRSD